MRRIYTYILVLLALGVACQRVDLPEVNQPVDLPVGAIGSKATITFSTADIMGPETRGVLTPVDPIINPSSDVKTLHLIVFDENGMLVEVCKADKLGKSDHVDPETGEVHVGGRHYTVTLTVTDEPRIIHYVANCPVDQVVYGHETSIIGNMFVDRNGSDGAKTEYETSYWARIEVPYILVTETTEDDKVVVSLVDEIKDDFTHVPLLRNYAEITVVDDTEQEDFEFIGFTVYNLLNRGTVAPYNSNTQRFQSFIYTNQETGGISNYSYPQISSLGYEGHALTFAQLITDFIRNDDGKVKIYNSNEPFYVYERKVSVMTDEEEKWRESPPHIIIKGRYNHGKPVDENSPVYYYKMDLVYTGKDADGNDTDIKYYNILRNFKYKFTLTQVHDEGYTSLDLAVAGAAGNNISGSSSTSKLTNVSDNEGRLWVSYTDITLVTNDAVTFRYKYIPNFYGAEGSEYKKDDVHNELVRFENTENGEVITGFVKATADITSGEWEGWREVTISIKDPADIIRQQTVSLKTNNVNLNRQIRFTLRKKLTMEVACSPKKVTKNSLQDMTVYVKLPTGMTDDMFPLELNMETRDRTLSPDATKNTIPVTAGNSIIDGKRDELSYYYTVIIPTFDDYKAQPAGGFPTYWRTNKAENASTFYVDNKYFNQGSDSWQNYTYTFSNVKCSSSALGVGQDVTISFKMDDRATNKDVTISLKGMTYNDAYVTTVKTSSNAVITLTGFKTTTDTGAVSFTLDADDYNIAEATGDRETYKFNGAFGATSLEAEADVDVDFTFNISTDAFDALKDLYPDAEDAGVPMFVTLHRLQPADDQLVYSQIRAEGDRYIYRIKQAGTQTIRLATTENIGGPCTVKLQADYFDTETVTIQQTDVEVKFIQWNSTQNDGLNSSNMEYVIVGQTIRYYVGILSDSKPTSVTIDGKTATELTDYSIAPQPTGAEASRTVWYIDWSDNNKGSSHEMEVSMVVGSKTITTTVGSVKVDLILGTSTTNPTKDGKTIYVVQNTNYTTTYWTSANNNLSASTSLNYSSLFTIDSNNRIKSVAKGQYCNGTNGNISFNENNGTTYTFNNGKFSYTTNNWGSSTTRYIRQSDTTNISLNTTNSNNTWNFYPIEPSLP